MASLTERADSSLAVPAGVSGAQRTAYLALTDPQKAHYRYHFYAMGQPAGYCLEVAPRESGCSCSRNA